MNKFCGPIKSSCTLWIFIILTSGALFELLPAVKAAQSYVSFENYKDINATCATLLNDRPWYGRINHWFCVWLLLTPAIIFLCCPETTRRARAFSTTLALTACYIFMNLAINLQWTIRNAPFGQTSFEEVSENGWRTDCFNIADGFSLVHGLLMGWIPASVYVWLSWLLWRMFYRRTLKGLGVNYKTDLLTHLLSIGVKTHLAATLLFLIVLTAHKAGLIKIPALGLLYYIGLRPLFIPFEIFVY